MGQLAFELPKLGSSMNTPVEQNQFDNVGVARWRTQHKIKKVPLLQRKLSYCLSKTQLLLLEELNNASIVAVSVFAVYDATKALAVFR